MAEDKHDEEGAARPQRRLAAILAADVAGYSRMMEADEEGTLLHLQRTLREVIRPAIDRHRGRIVKTTGDGFLAEFASLVEAVRCAVGLQQGAAEQERAVAAERRLVFRMGINLGDILIQDGDVFGDGVNIAARLEGLAEAGGIVVSQAVQDQVQGKVPWRFEDLGERQVKNIARPLRIYRVAWGGMPAAPVAAADKPSIAVLPFTNMSPDPEQAFFADGLAEDLITDLSKVPGLFVIARNSSFAYRGRALDVRQIARELGVRFIIEGSVRRAANRLRINAQLIEATSGNHLWADRFDRDLADVFAIQDEVVGRIVGALANLLPVAAQPATRRTTSIEAYDLFLRGRSMATQTPQSCKASRPLLEQAIALDPGFAAAHAWLALSHHFGWIYCGEPVVHRDLSRTAAKRAVAIDPENADARIMLGYLRAYEGFLDEGAAEFEAGLRLNPNHAEGWALMGDLRVLQGRRQDALDCVATAFRLNPHPPFDFYWISGWVLYANGRYADAVERLSHPGAGGAGNDRVLAAALARLGRKDEATAAARRFLAEHPDFSAAAWAATQPFRNAADRDHFIEGYLLAGLPA